MFHFDPYVQTVKQLIESGRIGTLLHYYSRSATYTTLKNSITHHQAYTPCSILMDCIHDTDLLRWLTGRVPDYVFARGIQAGDMARNSFPNIVDAMYRYDGKDFSAHAHYNYVQSPQVRELEIVGGKGYIQGDFMEPAITVGTMDGNVKKIVPTRDFDNVYRAEWDSFICAIRKGTPPENPAESPILPTLIMQAQIDSAAPGQEIAVRDLAQRCSFQY